MGYYIRADGRGYHVEPDNSGCRCGCLIFIIVGFLLMASMIFDFLSPVYRLYQFVVEPSAAQQQKYLMPALEEITKTPYQELTGKNSSLS